MALLAVTAFGDRIQGTGKDDVPLNGTPGQDQIYAGPGEDEVHAGGGIVDEIEGEGGDDNCFGEDGDDVFTFRHGDAEGENGKCDRTDGGAGSNGALFLFNNTDTIKVCKTILGHICVEDPDHDGGCFDLINVGVLTFVLKGGKMVTLTPAQIAPCPQQQIFCED
ncbi:MAG: hypothetical protein HYY18_05335 [Planctomycetes bacterium]|nr:hypothetical protein [Planctomycetota bacterium]